jgi:hypothetical protein
MPGKNRSSAARARRGNLSVIKTLTLATTSVLIVSRASADSFTYVGPTSGGNADWNNSSNWTDGTHGGIPGSSVYADSATINAEGYISPQVTLDYSPYLGSLSIGGGTFGGGTVTQNTATTLTNVGLTEIGSGGNYDISAGVADFNGGLIVGAFIGGTGNFLQTGGAVGVGAGLAIGTSTVTSGNYTLNSGTLTVSGQSTEFYPAVASIGFDGGPIYSTATFSQNGGTFNALVIKVSTSGTLNLTAGTINAQNPYYANGGNPEQITGTFEQTGGLNSITGNLDLASQFAYDGTYSLSSSGALSASGNILIGDAGTGTFTQSGGTSSSGGDEIVGATGLGTLNISAGTHTVGTSAAPANLHLAQSANSYGALNVSGGTLQVYGSQYIGESSSAAVTVSGGVLIDGGPSNGSNIYIGYNQNTTATFTISATGSVQDYGTEVAGTAGVGTITQSGGVNTLLASAYGANLSLGSQSTATGFYNLNKRQSPGNHRRGRHRNLWWRRVLSAGRHKHDLRQPRHRLLRQLSGILFHHPRFARLL